MADENENIRTLWSLRMEDIKFFKKQQYAVANYGLLLLAAIVAVRDELIPANTSAPTWRGFCLVGLALVTGGSLWQIHQLQEALKRARNDRNLARNHLAVSDAAFRRILDTQERGREQDDAEPLREHGDVEFLLMLVMLMGVLLSGVFVLDLVG